MLHIFKTKLRNYLTNSQKITISDEFVKKNSLPTKLVGIEHMSIKTLIN
jgi:5S rRNA maturation endonuclease (ribonuclease M5)